MVCSDADPIKESLLSVQSQVESSLQTCKLLNGKVKQRRNGVQDPEIKGMQYGSASLKSQQGAGHKSYAKKTEDRENAKAAYGKPELRALLGNLP